ncbi:hypothetical protein [Burkholderia vietnamiensis]|uniref:hypothetical protein n=1 Tax=Burkholderia vietnamiensis TaxID=60552 RepID=UPI0012D8E5E0|nr:hypothetical protein [Burkholderia vietnamiensis]
MNPDDGGRFASPVITYSIKTNRDWKIGAQFFMDRASSEYGRLHNGYYTQLQGFF